MATVDEFLVWTTEGRGRHYRLRVRWDGEGCAPWQGTRGLRPAVIEAVLKAANAVPGMPPVRGSLSSGDTLRLWFSIPRDATAADRGRIKSGLIRAVRETLAIYN